MWPLSSIAPSRPAQAPLPADLADGLERARAALGGLEAPAFFFPSIGSTNDEAARLAEAGAPDGTVVVADQQSAGRGRSGRSWFSPPGAGLYVSVVFRTGGDPPAGTASPALPAVLTLVAGVALAEAVRETTGLPVAIKWPNDLVHAGRKVAGILAEGSAQGAILETVILGFGINVRSVAFPREVALRASSIETELGRPVERGALFGESLVKLIRGRRALARGEVEPLLTRWRDLSPSATGARVDWRSPRGLRRGWTAGLDEDGALLVNIGGRVERVLSGEVIWG
jgi:BirA family biotin operon repressor/biotin-[acetyl-CoA-carboxylase] ligase